MLFFVEKSLNVSISTIAISWLGAYTGHKLAIAHVELDGLHTCGCGSWRPATRKRKSAPRKINQPPTSTSTSTDIECGGGIRTSASTSTKRKLERQRKHKGNWKHKGNLAIYV